jgi:zeta-carotene desaturase
VPLGELYVEPARAFIEARGGCVRGNALANVRIDEGRAAGVEIRGGDRLLAGAIVSAVPWHAVRRLFDEVPRGLSAIVANASAMVGYPIVTVNLWLDRPVMDVPFVGLPGRDMQWVFDKRTVWNGAASHLSLVSSGAAHLVGRTNGDIVALALRELRAALPRVAGAVLRHASVIRERNSTFSVAPGQPPRPGCRTELPGFVLAGDWTETTLPGTIESAAMSGHAAALAVEGVRGP